MITSSIVTAIGGLLIVIGLIKTDLNRRKSAGGVWEVTLLPITIGGLIVVG